jgi:hypothetical protein
VPDLSERSMVFLAVQMWLVTAVVVGFRHSVRIPVDLRARWLFHFLRPRTHAIYMSGARRAAVVKLVVPLLLVLLPLHVLAMGPMLAVLHSSFGLLMALLLVEASLLGYRRLPFASSYVPTSEMTTHGGVFLLVTFAGVSTVAWLEREALSTATGTAVLFSVTLTLWAIIRGVAVWQRRDGDELELDEVVDLPTLRFGLMD